MTVIDRSLGFGEVLAETARLYGNRGASTFGLGGSFGLVYLLALTLPMAAGAILMPLAMTVTFAVATRLAAGDSFARAWAQAGAHAPVLVLLTLAVSLPFAMALNLGPVFLLFGVVWLTMMGFAIPVAMVERSETTNPFTRTGYALRRAASLARAGFRHPLCVVLALVCGLVVFAAFLSTLLVRFADNQEQAATAVAQVVLWPFFVFGLAVLYFDQRVRERTGGSTPDSLRGADDA